MFHLRWSYFRSYMFWRKFKRILKIGVALVIICCFVLFVIASVEQKCPDEGCGITGTYIHKFQNREIRPRSEVKRILRWTGFFGDASWEDTDDSYLKPCKVNRCTLTNDRSLLDESDAVLFHVGALWNFWRGASLPKQRHAFQVWILNNVEPPPRVPLGLGQFAGVFNWTAWYRRDSDVPVGYGGYTYYPMPLSLKTVNKSMKPNWARENNRFSAWMSSNCYDYNRRQILIAELKAHLGKDMDLYGKCGTKRCPETICYDTISNYKFFFTFENANCKDYITEKFWAALLRRQVPVVYGASSAEYAKIAPPHSFIHVKDFKDTKSLVDYLHYLEKNETAYNEYLEWTTEMDIYSELPARRKWWCDLCEALHDESRPAQVYTDIEGWVKDDICPQWSIANQIGRLLDGLKIKIGLL